MTAWRRSSSGSPAISSARVRSDSRSRLAAPPEAAEPADASRHPTGWLRGGAEAAGDEVHGVADGLDSAASSSETLIP